MPLHLDIQQSEHLADWSLSAPVETMLEELMQRLGEVAEMECAVCFVDESTSAEMNAQYRQKVGPTNILSFPYTEMPGVETNLLGDLIICAPLIVSEAAAQNKTIDQHMTHLLVHGILHLLGYDHQTDEQAEIMEQLEIETLTSAGYTNPYAPIDP